LAAQQTDETDALMTLVQFDSHDLHEVLSEATSIGQIRQLDGATFVPRGGTPLYDAMGHTIADAPIRAEQRHGAGLPPEEILFVTFSDGGENQSVEYTQQQLFELIAKREVEGWGFAYMGANQDSYAGGGRIGHSRGSSQNFAADAVGSAAAFGSLSRAVSERRHKMRTGQDYDRKDLFEGDKGAEDDLRDRS
jgi:hypothetical protein